MLFGEDGACGSSALRELEERRPRESAVLVRRLGAGRLEDRREHVEELCRRVDGAPARDALAGEDQGHPDRLVVHVALAHHALLAHRLAVVRGIEDAGLRGEAGLVEGRDQLSDVVVEVAHHAVVGGDDPAQGGLVELALDVEELPVVLEPGMHRSLVRAVGDRKVDVLERVERVERIRREPRRMRADERHEERPRGVLAGRLFADPTHGPLGDVAIVLGVGRVPAPRLPHEVRELARDRHRVAADGEEHPDPVHDVHRHELGVESVRVVRVPVVELADRGGPPSPVHQPVPPGRLFSEVRLAVVPLLDVEDVAPGREARPRRNADGAVAVGVPEECPPLGERVEMRRPDDRMPHAPEGETGVLVGEDEEEVPGLGGAHAGLRWVEDAEARDRDSGPERLQVRSRPRAFPGRPARGYHPESRALAVRAGAIIRENRPSRAKRP